MLWLNLLIRSGALIFAALVSDYGASRERAAWIFSIYTSAMLLTAPAVGFLLKCNVSTKALSFCGSLVLGVSTILCFLSTDMIFLLVLLGVCSGIGTGVVFFVNDIVISQYFVRYRASASGINFSGGALAAFVYPPLFLVLMNSYGLKGALLITGGLSLNSLAGSLLFRAPPQANFASGAQKREQPDDGIGGCRKSDDTADGKQESRAAFSVSKSKDKTSDAQVPQEAQQYQSEKSHDFFSVLLKRKDDIFLDDSVIDLYKAHSPAASTTTITDGSVQSKASCSYCSVGEGDLHAAGLLKCSESEETEHPSSANGYHPCGPSVTDQAYNTPSAADAANNQFPSVASHSSYISHFEFLKIPAFYVSVITGLCFTYTMLVFVVLVDFAQEKGLSKQDGAVMLSVTSIGDAGARMLSGIVSDKLALSRRTMVSASKMMAGVVCFALPLTHSYPALLVLCSLFGWAIGTALVLLPPIMADDVGVQHLGLAFGASRFIAGVAYFGCPKLTGYFKDNVGSYTGLFYLIGSGCLVVAALWAGETVRIRMRKKGSATRFTPTTRLSRSISGHAGTTRH